MSNLLWKIIVNSLSLGLALGLCSCALYTPTPQATLVTTCNIPADQSGTINGHWAVHPIPIAFHQGDFSQQEMSSITAAADTWNTFFTASKTFPMIDYGGNASAPRTVTNPDPAAGSGALCAQGILQGSQFTGNVILYRLNQWPASYPSSAIALTVTCTTPTTPYASFYTAVMEINYQSFFTAGNRLPDMQSIILHEFGHLVGLNHSCESFQKTGTPNCTDPNLNLDYQVASMYPIFSFDPGGNGQVKQSLQTNDESRANCLY